MVGVVEEVEPPSRGWISKFVSDGVLCRRNGVPIVKVGTNVVVNEVWVGECALSRVVEDVQIEGSGDFATEESDEGAEFVGSMEIVTVGHLVAHGEAKLVTSTTMKRLFDDFNVGLKVGSVEFLKRELSECGRGIRGVVVVLSAKGGVKAMGPLGEKCG